MLEIFERFFDFCGPENKRKFRLSLVLGVVLALAEAMKIPAIMILLQAALEDGITAGSIWLSVLVLYGGLVVGMVVKYHSTMLQTEAGYGTAANKRIEIAEHLRYLPMGYFNRSSLGYITSVTTNTMENLSDVATRAVMLTTGGLFNTLLIALMVLAYDWRVGLLTLAGTALFLAANRLVQRRTATLAPRKQKSDDALVERMLELIQGLAEVKAFGLTGRVAARTEEAIAENANVNTEMEMTFVPLFALQSLIAKMTGVGMVLLSVWLYLNGAMPLMTCIGMMICSFLIYAALEQAGSYSALLRGVDISVRKAQEVLDLEPMDIDGQDIAPERCDIDLENVTFSYDTRKIIDGISLHIPQKTTTAIVGPSGGGKTTLCQLIARFWDVDSGAVRLGGHDVREYSMDSLMKNFSFVFQNVYLFRDTVANNIRFGSEDTPMEQVIAAAKQACCHDFIMALPQGYDTVIGEGGASLSGGERQRISIARAILKNSPVIILDEATANVDPENEKELTDAIAALTREKTILMIAHRLKTVRGADNILVVDHGQIVQQGRHADLMRQDGIYRRFVTARETAASWKL